MCTVCQSPSLTPPGTKGLTCVDSSPEAERGKLLCLFIYSMHGNTCGLSLTSGVFENHLTVLNLQRDKVVLLVEPSVVEEKTSVLQSCKPGNETMMKQQDEDNLTGA